VVVHGWAIMVVVIINKPLRQLWQTPKLMWSVSGSAWKGRCRQAHLLLNQHPIGLQTSVDAP
jgi:hypothetical protein